MIDRLVLPALRNYHLIIGAGVPMYGTNLYVRAMQRRDPDAMLSRRVEDDPEYYRYGLLGVGAAGAAFVGYHTVRAWWDDNRALLFGRSAGAGGISDAVDRDWRAALEARRSAELRDTLRFLPVRDKNYGTLVPYQFTEAEYDPTRLFDVLQSQYIQRSAALNEWMRRQWLGAREYARAVGSASVSALKTGWRGTVTGLRAGWRGVLSGYGATRAGLGAARDLVAAAYSSAWDLSAMSYIRASEFMRQTIENARAFAPSVYHGALGFVRSLPARADAFADRLSYRLVTGIIGSLDVASDAIDRAIGYSVGTVRSLPTMAESFANRLVSFTTSALRSTVTGVDALVESATTRAFDASLSALDAATSAVGRVDSFIRGIPSAVRDAYSNAVSSALDIYRRSVDRIPSLYNDARDHLFRTLEKARRAVPSLYGSAAGAVRSAYGLTLTGLRSGWATSVGLLRSAAAGIRSGASTAWGSTVDFFRGIPTVYSDFRDRLSAGYADFRDSFGRTRNDTVDRIRDTGRRWAEHWRSGLANAERVIDQYRPSSVYGRFSQWRRLRASNLREERLGAIDADYRSRRAAYFDRNIRAGTTHAMLYGEPMTQREFDERLSQAASELGETSAIRPIRAYGLHGLARAGSAIARGAFYAGAAVGHLAYGFGKGVYSALFRDTEGNVVGLTDLFSKAHEYAPRVRGAILGLTALKIGVDIAGYPNRMAREYARTMRDWRMARGPADFSLGVEGDIVLASYYNARSVWEVATR